MERRTFLKQAGLSSVAFALEAIQLAQLATGFPGKLAEMTVKEFYAWAKEVEPLGAEAKRLYPEAGWLETATFGKTGMAALAEKPPLFTADRGHFDYLYYFATNHPVLQETISEFYKLLIRRHGSQPLLLGDALEAAMTFAKHALGKIDTREPSIENQLHVAIYTLGTVFGSIIHQSDLHFFGIPDGFFADHDQVWQSQLYVDSAPRPFPEDQRKCASPADHRARCWGVDRSAHVFNHLFLAHIILYLKKHNLQDADRIVNGLKLLRVPLKDKSQRDIIDTIVHDEAAQFAWEIIETFDYLSGTGDVGYGDEGKRIPAGWLDNAVGADLKANRLGLNTALKLHKDSLSADDIREIIDMLNNPKIYQIKTG